MCSVQQQRAKCHEKEGDSTVTDAINPSACIERFSISLISRKKGPNTGAWLVLYLNFHTHRPCFGCERGETWKCSATRRRAKNAAVNEQRDRRQAWRLTCRMTLERLWQPPRKGSYFPPFFSSCCMIKSQMSDTARHPKSTHCINISHRWQLCIKTTCRKDKRRRECWSRSYSDIVIWLQSHHTDLDYGD